MRPPLAPANPGEVHATVQPPPVDVPGLDQVGDTAVQFAQIIALILIIGGLLALLRWLWSQIVIRVLLAVALAVFVTVTIMKASQHG